MGKPGESRGIQGLPRDERRERVARHAWRSEESQGQTAEVRSVRRGVPAVAGREPKHGIPLREHRSLTRLTRRRPRGPDCQDRRHRRDDQHSHDRGRGRRPSPYRRRGFGRRNGGLWSPRHWPRSQRRIDARPDLIGERPGFPGRLSRKLAREVVGHVIIGPQRRVPTHRRIEDPHEAPGAGLIGGVERPCPPGGGSHFSIATLFELVHPPPCRLGHRAPEAGPLLLQPLVELGRRRHVEARQQISPHR